MVILLRGGVVLSAESIVGGRAFGGTGLRECVGENEVGGAVSVS